MRHKPYMYQASSTIHNVSGVLCHVSWQLSGEKPQTLSHIMHFITSGGMSRHMFGALGFTSGVECYQPAIYTLQQLIGHLQYVVSCYV